MKKIIKKCILIFIVLIVLFSNFAFTMKTNAEENVKIGTAEVKEEQEEIKMPSESFITENREDDFNYGIATIATDASKFNYKAESNGTITITGYKGSDAAVDIPSQIGGKNVTKIGEAAFYQNTTITSVKIPNTVTIIERGAFAEARNLSSVTLGNSVQKINEYAFNYTKIESINIPASVTYIDSIAFLKDTSLKTITVDKSNKTYCDQNGIVFSKDNKKLITYPAGRTDQSYSIPSTVNTIGSNAFIDAKVQEVTIPTSVTKLEDWCFARSNLTKITLPSSITSMGNGPFDTCLNIMSAKIDAKIKTTPYRMFSECPKLSEVTLNDYIEEIYNLTFALCTNLKEITLPKNLKRIEYGFEKCSGITKVIIPASVEYISPSSFAETTVVDISKTKLQKLDNGSYAIVYNVYLNGTFYYDKANEVFEQLNKYRKEKGLKELTLDQELFSAAMERAKETGLLFEHTRPNGTSCFTACDKMNAENIAAGSSTATGAMNQWKNSSGHNANMLGADWQSVGIGCYYTNGVYYWVQCFSSKAGNKQTVIPKNKTEKQKVQTLDSNIEFYYKDKKDISVNVGGTLSLGNIYTVNKGWELVITLLEKESMQYTSSDNKIATVDASGKIKGISKGNVKIKASIGNKSLEFNLKVKQVIPNYGNQLMTTIEKESGNNYIMDVLLPTKNIYNSNMNILTVDKLKDLLNKKYGNGKVSKVYKTDGKTEINKSSDKVGTGYKVKLTSGEQLTVVLFGDINKDGAVNTQDSVAISEYNVGKRVLDKYQQKAAKLTESNDGKINTRDAVRIAYYNVNGLGTQLTGEALLDMQLYPEDYLSAQ